MKREEIPENLHQQIMLLFEDLKHIVPGEKRGMLSLVERFFELMDPVNLINHVISNILPHKKQIDEKDENFFLENKDLFGKLPTDEVNYFGDLIQKGGLTPQEKDSIWMYFQVFTIFAEKYKKDT